MGSRRLPLRTALCTGLLAATALLPAAHAADGTDRAEGAAVQAAPSSPAPDDQPAAPGTAHAVTGLVLAGTAAAAVVLLPRFRRLPRLARIHPRGRDHDA